MSHLKTTTKRAILAATLLSTAALSSGVVANAQTSQSAQINYATPLSAYATADKTQSRATLDWRKSSFDFIFDVPAANKTENIELLLSGDPQGGVNPRAPLTVQFNNEEPVLLNVNGQGFDARITLDPSRARAANNIVSISYAAEDGADCIAPQDGAWDIDLASSKLVVNSRAKRRGLQFNDLKKYFSNPSLAPRRVGLIATGSNATQLQALAAQGIGLNMDELPDFITEGQSGDFDIIMARRSELFKYISDDSYIDGRGAAVFIPRGRPAKLVFTGDTDAQILEAVKNFAELSLPTARRSVTSLGEMSLQKPHQADLVSISGTKVISSLPNASSFSNWRGDDWASGSKSLRFDVTDPNAMSGEVLLRLVSSKNVSDTSKLSVRLNGESLGTTVLDKRRKSVAFRIKAGSLRGKDNVVTLMPEINANEAPSCTSAAGPNFYLGGGSKIILDTKVPSPPTELSRMTATAMPFANIDGAQSYIAMPGSYADFNVSLKLLARLAKTSGQGLIAADYSRSLDMTRAENKNVLYIGPSNQLSAKLMQAAPRALSDALRGQAFEGDNLISSNIEQFANLDADASFKIAAQSLSQSRRIRGGGVAALYPSQLSDGRIIGVITNTPGQSFAASTELLTQAPYWSEIKGGVARWNEDSVLSAQAAQIVPGYKAPKPTRSTGLKGLSFDSSIFDGLYNKTASFTDGIWSNLKDFTAGLGRKVKPDTPATPTPDVSEPLVQAPDISPKLPTDWGQVTIEKLQGANDWARRQGAKIRKTASNFDAGDTLSKAQNGAASMSEKIRTFFKAPATSGSQQSLGQYLFSPQTLLLIIAFLLALLAFAVSKPASRDE